MRNFILDLLDCSDLVEVGWLTSLLELDLGHVETQVRLYDIRFYVIQEQSLIFVIASRLSCKIFGKLVLKKGVLEYLLPGDALLRVDCEHPLDEVLYFLVPLDVAELEWLIQDILLEFGEVLACPGRPAIEHFVEDNADGPDVALGGKLAAP